MTTKQDSRLIDYVAQLKLSSTDTQITLSDIETKITELINATQLSNWDLVQGNSIEYSYYGAGVVPNNPSGNAGALANKVYKQGATIVITKTYSYNASDELIKTTAS